MQLATLTWFSPLVKTVYRGVATVACYSFLEPQVRAECQVDSITGRAALKKNIAPCRGARPTLLPDTTVTVYSDIIVITVYRDILVVTVYSDITVVPVYSDIIVVVVYIDIIVVTVYSDITVVTVCSDIIVVIVYSDITVVIVYKGITVVTAYMR